VATQNLLAPKEKGSEPARPLSARAQDGVTKGLSGNTGGDGDPRPELVRNFRSDGERDEDAATAELVRPKATNNERESVATRHPEGTPALLDPSQRPGRSRRHREGAGVGSFADTPSSSSHDITTVGTVGRHAHFDADGATHDSLAHGLAGQDATTGVPCESLAPGGAGQDVTTPALLGPPRARQEAHQQELILHGEGRQDSATRVRDTSLTGEGLRRRGLSAGAVAGCTELEPTTFKLVLNGAIESANMGTGSKSPLMCVFAVTCGPDWTMTSGAPKGITQLAESSLPPVLPFSARFGGMREVVWNFPIGLTFKSTSPFGWPRLVVTVYGTDMCNRRVVKGYGSLHVPCQPGRHSRVIRLYCPLSSSPLTRIMGWLFGNPAQFVDPRIVAGTEGREVVRVQSGGKVRVSFDVLLKDTEQFNYAF